MRVTSIQKQVKTEGRYSIFIDGKFAFGLSELGLINSGLKIGQEVTDGQLAELKLESELDKLYSRVLALLARRPRSEWEIREYLRRKEADKEQIESILNTLSIRGYIDDADFARRWVESRRLLKPTSRRKLRSELAAKRIASDIIDQVLAEDEADELEVLRQEIVKKRRQTKYHDNEKLMAYLARQGYSYGDIKQALISPENN